MKVKKNVKVTSKFVAAILVGAVSAGVYSADAAGLTGSYVGIGIAPTDATVVKSGSEYNAKDIVGSSKLIDYRQTKRFNKDKDGNEILEDFSRVATNDNKNGEGVDGTATANDSRKGIGTTAIGFGTYASRGYATAIGTYSSAISGSTAVGSGSYATQYSAALGRNTYANSAVAVGEAARAADGIAIGKGASAGVFYQYIQNDGTQNYGAILNSIAIGPDATAVGGTAIGAKAQTNSLYGVALGQGSKVSYNGVALGVNAQVTAKGNGGIALGTSSVANRGAGTIGYMPLVDGVEGKIAKNDTELATFLGASDDIKNFTTKYAAEISKYNQLNKKYSDIKSQQDAQEQIMIATKGNDDAAYKAAKAEYDKLSKEAVAATNARNAWTASHQDFTQAMAEQQSALAAFKATDGAVSVGSDAYVDARTGKTIQNTRQIINVAAGTEDTDAVNVAQLKHVADETAKKVNIDASNITPEQVNNWQVALGINQNTVGNVDAITLSEGANVKIDPTYNDDKSRVNYEISVSDEAIKTAVKPELDQKANLDGSNLTPDAITNWKDQLGVTNVTNEVSGLNNRVDGLESNVSNLNNRVNKLDQRVDKVGAGAAALAGLHPLEFNPDDKFSAAVAMGSYKGQGAAALGGFYRPNADTMFSVSSTIGDDPMFNIGLSLKFGQKGDDIYRNANATNIGALTSEVNALKAENKGLADQVATQKAELEEQRALIQQLMAKVGM
ncbi:YadA-like family protein [Veillonella intestinalis]|uniref:YadA-like family protein n=1 Tax=Veillonella intestinalis TaxID=2941341 RepID=UPI00203EE7B5|nr:YadA-like family protein [Veillonella intestinalis]